uniref:Putative nuclear membrane protein involved in mrna transport n=2 Tax=Ixodes ricinus TaxID=34613 RepID=V5H8E0_IXORI
MAPYMSLPLKLHILRALDAATYTRAGMQELFATKMLAPPEANVQIDLSLIAEPLDELYESKKSEMLTGYQVLLKLLFLKQSTRATVALTALLKKLHLYDLLCMLHTSVDKIVQDTDLREVKEKDEEGTERTRLEVETGQAAHCTSEDLDKAAVCLDLLCRTYRKAHKEVAQPLRYLPAQSRFEAPQTPFDPYPALFRMFKENHLLEMMSLLASSPVSSSHTGVAFALREFLAVLLKTRPGMLFFLSDHEAANCLHRALLQEESGPVGMEDSVYHQVGVHLVYHLQTLQHVDSLLAYHSKGGVKRELDDAEVVTCLHDLYTVLFSDVGRAAVVDVLAMHDNLDALVPFLRLTGDMDFDTRLCKSVCAGYATELLLLTVHNSDSAHLLKNYSDVLYQLSQQEMTPRLQELSAWIEPTRKLPSYTHESVTFLMGCVKKAAETAALLPPELVTALRILRHLGLPPRDFRSGESDDEEELKYKYVIMQIFANDGLSCFLTILQKISEEYLKPYHGPASLVGQQGAQVVATVKPVVNLLQFMLGYLISCRGTEFKDVTAVPVLLQTFTLLGMIPASSPLRSLAMKVQVEIVETLLTYTQPHLSSAETEEALNKSLWTQMISEVLKYTLRAPYTFVTGLTVLSELLPLPLPLQIREPLSSDDLPKVVNSRKLWSAYLHSLSADIQEIVGTLSYSTCPTVQQLFRRVCIQLSDLAAPSASVVARALLDMLHSSLAEPPFPGSSPPVPMVDPHRAAIVGDDIRGTASLAAPATVLPPVPKLLPSSSTILVLLDQFCFLVSHGPFKVAVLHALKGSPKYGELFTYLLGLLNLSSDELSHIHTQECILSVVQALCDPDIALTPIEENLSGMSTTQANESAKGSAEEKPDLAVLLKKLANSVPPKEQLQAICSALVHHIGTASHSYSSVLLAVRVLVMLTEHDFGFFCIKTALEREPESLCLLLDRLSATFDKDNADSLSTLSACLELMWLLCVPEEEGPLGQLRSLRLGPGELASLINWKGKTHLECHPLLRLEKLLGECSREEEALESLLASIASQLEYLGRAASSSDREMLEPMLPAQDGLSAQFGLRTVYLLGEIDEERLSPSFWLAAAVDDSEQEPEQVEVDLASMMERTLPDFNLKSELEKLILSGEEETGSSKSPLVNKRKLMLGAEAMEPTTKKPFIAPMRGRGFSRGGMGHTSRANDPFRSRPPNTSRPPSMHVDDFLALESHQHPLATGVAKRPIKEVVSVHGRGRSDVGGEVAVFDGGRPMPNRGNAGRFFSPPGLYGRREPSRMDGRDFGAPPFAMGGARSNSMVLRAIPAWSDGRGSSVVPKPLLGASNVVPLTGGPADPQQAFGRASLMEPRSSPRSRVGDPYGMAAMPGSSVGSDRFVRGIRGAMMPTHHAHWMDPRAKAMDSRFISTSIALRVRRDGSVLDRHPRAFTR